MQQLLFEALVHLFAQIVDLHVDDVGVGVEVQVPDLFGNVDAAYGLALIHQQILQQGILAGGQLDAPPGSGKVQAAVSISRSTTRSTARWPA